MQRIIRITGVMVLAALAATVARSAPLLPKAPRLSDEVLTMVGINRVELLVMPLPEPLVDAGVDLRWVRNRFGTQLAAAGIDLVQGGGAPSLRLHVRMIVSDKTDRLISHVNVLTLEQNVRIDRLRGRAARIPTWTGILGGMGDRENLKSQFEKTVQKSIGQFLIKTRAASDYRP